MFRAFSRFSVLLLSIAFPPLPSSYAAAQSPKTITISWKCMSNQRDPRYPCVSSTQRIVFFTDGRVLLQEKGPLCLNENSGNRRTYDAFLNRSASGRFVCSDSGFDFEISYSTSVDSNKSTFDYVLSGNLRQKLGKGDVDTGQRLAFKTRVNVKMNGSNCTATRSYSFSEYFGDIPRIANANYRYISTSCSNT